MTAEGCLGPEYGAISACLRDFRRGVRNSGVAPGRPRGFPRDCPLGFARVDWNAVKPATIVLQPVGTSLGAGDWPRPSQARTAVGRSS